MSQILKDLKLRDRVLLCVGVFAIIMMSLVVYVIYQIVSLIPSPEVVLPALLITGVSTLLISLTITAIILAALHLGDNRYALALPKGSVRAIIALSLIIIFAIMGVHLFRGLEPKYEWVTHNNVTEYKQIEPSEAQIDFGKQMLTTVGTLVVAVAGFYFGTRSVEAAPSPLDELRKLKESLEAKAITKNEYEEKRKKLVEKI